MTTRSLATTPPEPPFFPIFSHPLEKHASLRIHVGVLTGISSAGVWTPQSPLPGPLPLLAQ